jgi:hypothetical protein
VVFATTNGCFRAVRTTQDIYQHLTGGAEKRAADKMDEVFGPVASR